MQPTPACRDVGQPRAVHLLGTHPRMWNRRLMPFPGLLESASACEEDASLALSTPNALSIVLGQETLSPICPRIRAHQVQQEKYLSVMSGRSSGPG